MTSPRSTRCAPHRPAPGRSRRIDSPLGEAVLAEFARDARGARSRCARRGEPERCNRPPEPAHQCAPLRGHVGDAQARIHAERSYTRSANSTAAFSTSSWLYKPQSVMMTSLPVAPGEAGLRARPGRCAGSATRTRPSPRSRRHRCARRDDPCAECPVHVRVRVRGDDERRPAGRTRCSTIIWWPMPAPGG